MIKKLKALGIRVSLFMDADSLSIAKAKELGADRIELYTEPYATAFRTGENLEESLLLYAEAAKKAGEAGLGINAGHDLNLENLGRFCSEVPGVLEVSIGHALVSEALKMGFYNTVAEYVKILSEV